MGNAIKKLDFSKKTVSTNETSSPSSTSTYVSTKTISDLFEPDLLNIFSKLPLFTLIHIDEVCQNWKQLKSATLRQQNKLFIAYDKFSIKASDLPIVFSKFRDLKDHNGSPCWQIKVGLDQHTLYYTEITPMLVDNVIELMPKLKVLFIEQPAGTCTELWKIKLLLELYRDQLEEVSIMFHGETDEEDLDQARNDYQNIFTSFFRTLNRMTALSTLTLDLYLEDELEAQIEIDLSVASQLKKLDVDINGFTASDDDNDVLKFTYEQYCEGNEKLVELKSFETFSLNTLFAFGPRVTAALRTVTVEGPTTLEQYENFKLFSQKFPHVEELGVAYFQLTIAQMVETLLPCKSIFHFGARINFDQELELPTTVENNLPVGTSLPVFPSVKKLALEIISTSHRDLEKLNLDIIFPNVEEIVLRHVVTRCTDCHFQVPNEIEEMPAEEQTAYVRKAHKCMRLARAPFARFTKLTTFRANLGLMQLISSYQDIVFFTRETLDQETFSN